MLEIVAIALLAAVLASFLIIDAAVDAEDEAGQPWADPEAERKLDE